MNNESQKKEKRKRKSIGFGESEISESVRARLRHQLYFIFSILISHVVIAAFPGIVCQFLQTPSTV